MHRHPSAPPRRDGVPAAPGRLTLLLGVLVLTGCSRQQPPGTGAGPRLGTMPVWLLVVVVICLVGAGALLWAARHPLPSTDTETAGPGGSDSPDAPPVTRPRRPAEPRPPALTPAEFGIDTVLVAIPPTADPMAKMTRKSSLRHTRSRSRARPLPGGWPPPHPDWKDPA